jgi:hypothetical protein
MEFRSDLSTDSLATSSVGVIICHSLSTSTLSFHWCPDRKLSAGAISFFRSSGWEEVTFLPYSSRSAWESSFPQAQFGVNLSSSAFVPPASPTPSIIQSSMKTAHLGKTPASSGLPPSPRSALLQRKLETSMPSFFLSRPPPPPPPPHPPTPDLAAMMATLLQSH